MMSIGRISMLEFMKPEDVDASEEYYKTIRADFFPTLELVLNIRKDRKPLLSIAVYPSYEAAQANLPDQTSSRIERNTTRRRNLIRETKIKSAKIGDYTR